MADLAGGHEALHRQVLAKVFARLGGGARKVLLDEHPRLAAGLRREQANRADEIAGVRDGHRVLTAVANARLEDHREFHDCGKGFDCCRLTIGRDLPAKRRRQAAVAERFTLQELVHEAPGHLWRVVVESELCGHYREKNDVLVAVGHQPVGRMLSHQRGGLFRRQTGKVHHGSDFPQQPAGEGVLGNALVD
jgi:hypothetical protein